MTPVLGESESGRPGQATSRAAENAPVTGAGRPAPPHGTVARVDGRAAHKTHGAAVDLDAVTAATAGPAAAAMIRDRRELPFFQVRLLAVQAIRAQTCGPRLVRAIGFYALLCQLANEQRHAGAHRLVRFTYDIVADRGQMSKRTVKVLLDALERAGVVRYERHADRATGGAVSLLHLLIHEDPWTAITVAMADRLAAPRPGGHVLRDLGLIVVLLELCAEQRQRHGGLAAEVMRGEIGSRSGLTVDRVDDCTRALERAGLLDVHRRRAGNGGRHLPSVYTVREAPDATSQLGPAKPGCQRINAGTAAGGSPQGGVSVPAGQQNGTRRAAFRYQQGGILVPAGRQIGARRAADRYRVVVNSVTPVTVTPPSNARTGPAVEKGIEDTPPTPLSTRGVEANDAGGGGGDGSTSPQELCKALLAAWQPVLGDSPCEEFRVQRMRWLNAAAAVLARHPRDRLDAALAYMVGDEILGSQAITMPGFARIADQLIARANARRLRASGHGRPAGDRATPRWDEARQALERAIRRHGRDGRRPAVDELTAESPLLVRFVERVGWTSLCEQPFQYAERRYAELWRELVDRTREQGEEPST